MVHPLTWEKPPIKRTEKEIEQFYEDYPGPYRNLHEFALDGVIEDKVRQIRIPVRVVRCLRCGKTLNNEQRAQEHLEKCRVTREALRDEWLEVEYSDVFVYYLITRPRKPLPLPPSVEFERSGKCPTAEEREKHDREMAEWRQRMKTNPGPIDIQCSFIPGPGQKFYYVCPQVWDGSSWKKLDNKEILEHTYDPEKTRVLLLLAIVPEGIPEEEEETVGEEETDEEATEEEFDEE